jgi:hypothetical protein
MLESRGGGGGASGPYASLRDAGRRSLDDLVRREKDAAAPAPAPARGGDRVGADKRADKGAERDWMAEVQWEDKR